MTLVSRIPNQQFRDDLNNCLVATLVGELTARLVGKSPRIEYDPEWPGQYADDVGDLLLEAMSEKYEMPDSHSEFCIEVGYETLAEGLSAAGVGDVS